MNSLIFSGQSFKQLLIGFGLLTMLVSCGRGNSPQIIKDVNLSSTDVNGEVMVSLGVSLDMGNVALPTVSIPIMNPKNTSQIYGEVKTRGGFNGVNDIEVSVNLTQALAVQGGRATLPDGSPLPIGGLGQAAVVQIPLAQDRHRLYLAAEEGVALLGAALTFKEFDSIGSTIGGADLMLPFTIRGVRGVFGFFTSTQSKQSGFALFVDLGSLLTPSEILASQLASAYESGRVGLAAHDAQAARLYSPEFDQSKLFFLEQSTSKSKKKKFDKALYKLHKREEVLDLN